MQLIYNDTDITDSVEVISAIHREYSSDRCDCLDLEVANARAWLGWQPKTDDVIEVIHRGYSTGKLYVNTIMPDGDTYRIASTGMKTKANVRAWGSYHNKTLEDIINSCASECGMQGRLYGIEKGIRYRFLLRNNESAGAFLCRLMALEGAALKAVTGRFSGIDILTAQDADPIQTIQIDEMLNAVRYVKRDNMRYSALTIQTPFGKATATDPGAEGTNERILTNVPVQDNIHAGRWARGLLLMQNRKAETLEIESEFNAGFSSLARIDIESGTDLNGEWIIDQSAHDFIEDRSTATLVRCIRTIR